MEKLCGNIPTLLLGGENAQIVICSFVGWIEAKRRQVIRLCCEFVALTKSKIAQGEIRFGIIRNVSIREVELLLGKGEVVGLERLPTRIVAVQSPERRV